MPATFNDVTLIAQPTDAVSVGTLYPGGTLVGVDGIIVEEDFVEPLTEPVIITIERIDINDYPCLRDTQLPRFVTDWQGSHYIVEVEAVNEVSELPRKVSVFLSLPLSPSASLNTPFAVSFHPAESQMPGIAGPPISPGTGFQISEPVDRWFELLGEVTENGTHFRFVTNLLSNDQSIYGLPLGELPESQTSGLTLNNPTVDLQQR